MIVYKNEKIRENKTVSVGTWELTEYAGYVFCSAVGLGFIAFTLFPNAYVTIFSR